jgi:hypothetical protein
MTLQPLILNLYTFLVELSSPLRTGQGCCLLRVILHKASNRRAIAWQQHPWLEGTPL